MRNLIHNTITTNLLKARASKRYSQERIAIVLDIKQSSYNKMEAGYTRISSDQLGILAAFYKIDICDFYKQEADFDDECISLAENNKQLKVELAKQKIYNNILFIRNEELEDKIKRKKAELELLQIEIDNLSTKKFRGNLNAKFSSSTMPSVTDFSIIRIL